MRFYAFLRISVAHKDCLVPTKNILLLKTINYRARILNGVAAARMFENMFRNPSRVLIESDEVNPRLVVLTCQENGPSMSYQSKVAD